MKQNWLLAKTLKALQLTLEVLRPQFAVEALQTMETMIQVRQEYSKEMLLEDLLRCYLTLQQLKFIVKNNSRFLPHEIL